MPLYEYGCVRCEETKELIRCPDERLSPVWCSECGADMIVKVSPAGLRFKGGGWDSNTYRVAKGSELVDVTKSEDE